jgi:uncharacterized protein GlcG (DUF336 family)
MTSFSRRSIDLRTTFVAIEAVIAKAVMLGLNISVAVTDSDGSVKASARMDNASSLTAEIAANKAFTSASLGMPTHEVFEFVKNEPPLLHGFSQYPRILVFGGGYPLKEGSEIIGGIGVSGGHYRQDMECAIAGLEAISAAKS